MLSNYHTLAYLASSLNSRLSQIAIEQTFTQERGELAMIFDGIDEVLLITLNRDVNILYLQPGFSRATRNSTNVLKACYGQTISSVVIDPSDRVIIFKLVSGYSIHNCFFGAKANVLLANSDGVVIDAFKGAARVAGTKLQQSQPDLVYDLTGLAERILREAALPVSSILKATFPTLGSTLVSEILFRAGLPERVANLSKQEIEELKRSMAEVLQEIRRPQARVYVHPDGVPERFSIIQLCHLGTLREHFFDDVHEAIRFFVSKRRTSEALEQKKRNIVVRLKNHLGKLQKTSTAVEADLQTSNRAEDYGRFGEALLMNLGDVAQGMKTVTLADPDGDITIPLDARLTPVQNAQKYFEKAKRSRAAQEQATTRLGQIRQDLSVTEPLIGELEQINTKEALHKFVREHAVELDRLGLGEKSKGREQLPFRIFTVDGGFEVWVGKSSTNNDLLTMKHAKPNDVWFHARGAGGSHVILKVGSGKGEPGKKAKEQAAGIAAYYSKMKNAKMVPVAMTARKYVRKPKGAPPGTVVIEREKVIFVEPALPDRQ
ncbi:MAG: NFACT family protein [Ignavibacteriae bacterium]|nr:NFACT family protein [Ignavibacteriota bacterium]